MFGPFKLKKTLGRSYNVDLDDTLRTKYALRGLGYFKEPEYGMTKYPEDDMFKGIKRFQSDHGLQKDGIMKPGGETERTLRAISNAAEKKFLTGPFVSTVAIVDAAIFVNAAVVASTAVMGSARWGFGRNGK